MYRIYIRKMKDDGIDITTITADPSDAAALTVDNHDSSEGAVIVTDDNEESSDGHDCTDQHCTNDRHNNIMIVETKSIVRKESQDEIEDTNTNTSKDKDNDNDEDNEDTAKRIIKKNRKQKIER